MRGIEYLESHQQDTCCAKVDHRQFHNNWTFGTRLNPKEAHFSFVQCFQHCPFHFANSDNLAGYFSIWDYGFCQAIFRLSILPLFHRSAWTKARAHVTVSGLPTLVYKGKSGTARNVAFYAN